jgi:hypothetical protein
VKSKLLKHKIKKKGEGDGGSPLSWRPDGLDLKVICWQGVFARGRGAGSQCQLLDIYKLPNVSAPKTQENVF